MGELTDITKDILCSIAIIPCTLQELMEREFLKSNGGFDEYYTYMFLNAEWGRKYWYEDRNGVFHIYAKALKNIYSNRSC